jgi:hypothetical protein
MAQGGVFASPASGGAHGGVDVSPAKVATARTNVKATAPPSLFRFFMFLLKLAIRVASFF